jgi:DtxR family transcriptional regulator, Mn-dependent transcriptional regulator
MTETEENYLKIIYHLSGFAVHGVNTNAIAAMLQTKASSVTDMLKKLHDKGLVWYKKYQGVTLTDEGKLKAKLIIRKHRLWEVFLVEKLGFAWDEVHDIAEQLEHIQSDILVSKLDTFLNFPAFDPHGDPIPTADGQLVKINHLTLQEATVSKSYTCVGVKDTSAAFLKHLNKQNIALGTNVKVLEKEKYDESITIEINQNVVFLSGKIAANIYVK